MREHIAFAASPLSAKVAAALSDNFFHRQGMGRLGRSPGNKFLPPSEDAQTENSLVNAKPSKAYNKSKKKNRAEVLEIAK